MKATGNAFLQPRAHIPSSQSLVEKCGLGVQTASLVIFRALISSQVMSGEGETGWQEVMILKEEKANGRWCC